MPFHIVLVEPEIPSNTGNIARTCAGTGSVLHLVRPLGFSTDDKKLKRAGLDYWHAVEICYYNHFLEVQASYPQHRFFFATTKAQKHYTDFHFEDGDFLVFGKETRGLPEELLHANRSYCMRVPMTRDVRSLNLANSVAIILYEALRQNQFPGLL